jgi:sorting nexin-41/42
VRLFPTLIIPPIPEKHSVADYAAAPRKATEDVNIIELRKRMLQSFLNRLAQHPILRRDHVVHRFLIGDASWVISLNYKVNTRMKSSILLQFPIYLKISSKHLL